VSFYERTIVPHLIRLSMRNERLVPYRRRLASGAEGRVLEIGFGPGSNVPFYDRADTLLGLDPSAALLTGARHEPAFARFPVRLLNAAAEAIPLDDASIDTVVTSWTLCSVARLDLALAEVRRVLRPSGRLRFVEHGRAPDASVARWQDRLTPIWRRMAGGCHMNRPVDRLLVQAGFEIERLDAAYMAGPRILTFMYEGSARRG
jgi:ubiquinone/menaquinone biosynthesis C-methylase UbiE